MTSSAAGARKIGRHRIELEASCGSKHSENLDFDMTAPEGEVKPQSSIIFVEIASAPVNAAHSDHLQLAGGISGYPMRIQVRWTQQGRLANLSF